MQLLIRYPEEGVVRAQNPVEWLAWLKATQGGILKRHEGDNGETVTLYFMGIACPFEIAQSVSRSPFKSIHYDYLCKVVYQGRFTQEWFFATYSDAEWFYFQLQDALKHTEVSGSLTTG